MNIEQLEYELTLLKGKMISLIMPLFGSVSYSTLGPLQVVEVEHRVGFHVATTDNAIIFYAEDVQSLEPSKSERFTKIIRLKKF
jgi:hypothetical protein